MARTATAPETGPVRHRRIAGSALATAALIAGLGATGPSASGASPTAPAASAAPTAPTAPALPAAVSSRDGTAHRPPAAGSAARAPWVRPLTARKVRVSQKYGIKGNWAAGHHTGIDFAVPVGTSVRSVGTGTVVFAGRSGAYGKAVTIRMTDGKYTLFAHLSAISVRKGQRVHAGTWIGRSGNSGRSTGPHLHFEVRAKRGYGTDIDPVRYMASHGVRLL